MSNHNAMHVYKYKNMTEEKRKSAQKNAIVTGSSSGIGYETSLSLTRKGFLIYTMSLLS
jgi:NADP-dependent 3-hydroxy acid dehydrogenase YdfG